MKTIKQLESKATKLRTQARVIDNQIEAIKIKKDLPKMRKMYQGKYFKFDNGTSRENRWWLYIFCRKVLSDKEAMFDSFELTKNNNDANHFRVNEQQYFTLCQVEITQEEYMRALDKFQKEFKKLYGNGK